MLERRMNDRTPTFAVVGAVNHGKSSVVSTLAENDQVRISRMPGETVECQRFWLRDLFVFYDTPGFQNAFEALAELQPAAQAKEPLQLFRDFIARHRGGGEFEAERRLFTPIMEGAGIIYVVDGSRPLRDIHAAEMEILRLTGQPRLAIINRTGADDHVQEWKRRLALHFNAIREFDAHRATFADRIELLETLAGIEQTWKPKLSQAVNVLREEWDARIGDCAEVVVEMLIDCLTHRESAAVTSRLAARREALASELKERFAKTVTAREARAHAAIIKLFAHNLVRAEAPAEQLFDAGLFSDETWRAFGLSETQLVAAGTVAGAAAGAAVDAATIGHTLLAGSAIGAAVGAAGAFAFGKRRPELNVKLPWKMPGLPRTLQFGGNQVRVGPYRAVNFPWILLDRAIGTFCYVINRAHARRDLATIDSTRLKKAMEDSGIASARWDASKRKECERSFTAIRRGKFTTDDRRRLRDLLRARLEEVSAMRLDSAKL
jgi:uncharacterized protein DUF3482/50S ribosome-binding GTPase